MMLIRLRQLADRRGIEKLSTGSNDNTFVERQQTSYVNQHHHHDRGYYRFDDRRVPSHTLWRVTVLYGLCHRKHHWRISGDICGVQDFKIVVGTIHELSLQTKHDLMRACRLLSILWWTRTIICYNSYRMNHSPSNHFLSCCTSCTVGRCMHC